MFQIKRTQFVHTDLATCWDFFSNPKNLQKITPKKMGFVVLTDPPEKIYEGLMIEYTVRPLLNIPLNWITEITHIENGKFFVDEQRKGPYKIWHHEHHFKEVENGVEMTDIVSYELPFGIIGKSMHSLLVRKQLEKIFLYRFKAVDELFQIKTKSQI